MFNGTLLSGPPPVDAIQARASRPHRGKFLDCVAIGRLVCLNRAEVRALEDLRFMDVWEGLLALRRGSTFIDWLSPVARAARFCHGVGLSCCISHVQQPLARPLGRRGATPTDCAR